MSDAILSATGLCRRYGRRWALAGVDLSIARGTATALAGRNGSGKSTLLRVLATAIRPDRGLLSIDGRSAWHDVEWTRRQIAFAGHATCLYDDLSGRQNLEVTASLLRSAADLPTLLARVGLRPDREELVGTYSAGMKKRLSLARLLLVAGPATVVLMDEPHASLDREGYDLVESIVRDFLREGKAVVMATHLFDRAAMLCDLAVVLDEGREAWSGRAADLPDAPLPELR